MMCRLGILKEHGSRIILTCGQRENIYMKVDLGTISETHDLNA